ncbi:hypothetical protein NC652_030065 [Populus alba x Populus x berolinensis]|nr:hypothetical protein NC652_030065 [Populus alba x Populus x berolinensis]
MELTGCTIDLRQLARAGEELPNLSLFWHINEGIEEIMAGCLRPRRNRNLEQDGRVNVIHLFEMGITVNDSADDLEGDTSDDLADDNVDCESADDSAHNLSNDNVDCKSADDSADNLADDTVDDCDNE